MRLAPIRRRAVLDARLAGGQLLEMQCELLVLVLGGLHEVRQNETGSSVATTLCNKAICISFAGDAFLATPHDFGPLLPAIHSSCSENFGTGLVGGTVSPRRAASHKDSWRPNQLQLSSSSTRQACVRRRRVTHFHPLSRFEPSAGTKRRSNCIAKAAVTAA